jgi:hypothetical protein
MTETPFILFLAVEKNLELGAATELALSATLRQKQKNYVPTYFSCLASSSVTALLNLL